MDNQSPSASEDEARLVHLARELEHIARVTQSINREIDAIRARARVRAAAGAEFAPCHKCASCGGSAHPATGCQYSETMLICGRCVREAWRWIRGHTSMVKRVGPKGSKHKVSFYEAAGRNRPKDNGV